MVLCIHSTVLYIHYGTMHALYGTMPACHRCSFLLKPLKQLDEQWAGSRGPSVLLLLDALDEADHNGAGWMPVAALIARE